MEIEGDDRVPEHQADGDGPADVDSLEEVGRIFRVTRERVRQIEAKAVRKLQHPVRARRLGGFFDSAVGEQG